MSHKKDESGRQKAINPEERLQKSVASDIKIAQMEHHLKNSADALSCAVWENKLHQKDDLARAKRVNQAMAADAKLNKTMNRQMRKVMLEALYKQDEMKYEEELNMRGLTYRMERV